MRDNINQSPAIQEYLEALGRLEEKESAVRPAQLARHLGLAPSSVSDMLRRLQSQGLVERTSDQGVRLSESGRLMATRMVRRHRLLERFLVDVLGLSWHGAHEEACRLEHGLSADSEEGLARLLEGAETCPHGNPIPAVDGEVPRQETLALHDLRPQESGYVVCIEDENQEELRYLASLGLVPGAQVTLEELAPFNGPVLISVGRARYAVGREIASKVRLSRQREESHCHRHRRRGGRRWRVEAEQPDGL